MRKYRLCLILLLLIATVFITLLTGRYPLSLSDLGELVAAFFTTAELDPARREALFVLTHIRIPRILAAMLVGAGLSVSGAAYQAMFLNPLVSPGILGVLAGASFGAGLGIVVFRSWVATQILAFGFGCAAVGLSLFFASFFRRNSLMVLLLGGMISGSLFTAFTSLLKFVADPNQQLPELVYWLMGSFARVDTTILLWVGLPMVMLIVYLCAQGKVTNVLSMGDEEALSMGICVKRTRLSIILAATLLSAFTVLLTGIIAWVGLVIPHIMRFVVGPNNRVLLPASAFGGAMFMLITDAVVRSVFTAELPIGVFTSLVALPLFVLSLAINKGGWR